MLAMRLFWVQVTEDDLFEFEPNSFDKRCVKADVAHHQSQPPIASMPPSNPSACSSPPCSKRSARASAHISRPTIVTNITTRLARMEKLEWARVSSSVLIPRGEHAIVDEAGLMDGPTL